MGLHPEKDTHPPQWVEIWFFPPRTSKGRTTTRRGGVPVRVEERFQVDVVGLVFL